MYSLENAVSALRNTNPWLLETVDFEALEGITDGTNRILRTPHRPLDEDYGITVYQQSGTSVGSANYTVVSWASGVLRFALGVSEQYYADYAVADVYYSATQLKNICQEGFREMMTRWPQAWYVVESGGSTWISSDASSLTDPPIGSVTFSTSHQALRTFHLACEYQLAMSRYRQAAASDVDYREGMSGGVAVTTHFRAQALQALITQLDKDLTAGLVALEDEVTGEAYGGFVAGAKSDAYENVYEWWSKSTQANS